MKILTVFVVALLAFVLTACEDKTIKDKRGNVVSRTVIQRDSTYPVAKLGLKPGTIIYAPKPGRKCKWTMYRISKRDKSNIVDRKGDRNKPKVTIESGDYLFKTTNCGKWIRPTNK